MKIKNNSSLIIKYFISILSLFIIPIIVVCIIINIHSNRIFRDITTDLMQYSLNSLLKTVEGAFDDAEKITLQLTFDERLSEVSGYGVSGRKSVDEIYKYHEVFGALQSLTDSNKNISSILVYNKDSGKVISSDCSMEDISFYKDSEWFKRYSANADTLMWVKSTAEHYEYSAKNREEVISTIYPISPDVGFEGAIIINIPVKPIAQMAYDNSGLFIITPDKKDVLNLSGGDEFNLGDENYAKLKKLISENEARSGTAVSEFNGEKYVVSFVTSSYNNMCFVMLTSEGYMFRIINKLMWFAVIIVLMMFVIGLVVAAFFSQKFYSPVKKIADDIKLRTADLSASGNEWKYIEQAVDRLIKQDKEMKERKRISERLMLIKQIISDGIENWEDYHEFFVYRYFSVIIVEVDNISEFTSMYGRLERKYMIDLALDVVKNTINSTGNIIADGFTHENSFTVLINTEMDSLHEQRELFSLIMSEVKKIINAEATVAVGGTVEAGSVSVSFDEAKSALEERFFNGNGTVIFHKGQPAQQEEVKIQEALFVNNLKLVKREQVYEYLKDITRRLGNTGNAEYVRQQMILILVIVLRCANENNIPSSVFTAGRSIFGELMDCKTINDAYDMLCNVCENIMKHFEIKLDENNFKNRIMEYVHKNYLKDIDVYTMAHELGISYSQLRRLFMEYTGDNIVVYTNRLRTELAKRLLIETDKTIAEIAIETGYNNDQSLNRNFKKFEGLTPGEFRKKHYNL